MFRAAWKRGRRKDAGAAGVPRLHGGDEAAQKDIPGTVGTVAPQEIHQPTRRNPQLPRLKKSTSKVVICTSWVYKPAGVPLLINRVLPL